MQKTSAPTSIVTSNASLLSQPKGVGKGKQDSPEEIRKAATQFEALLIGEVMKSAHAADGSGWMGADESEAGSTLSDYSEQQLSQALASSGGLGLAKMISSSLAKASATAPKLR